MNICVIKISATIGHVRYGRKEKLWIFWIEELVCVLREGVSTASERLCFSHLDEMNENYMTSESQAK